MKVFLYTNILVFCSASVLQTKKPEILLSTPESEDTFLTETTQLHCYIQNLGSASVTWIRKKDQHVISVGTYIFTNDKRFGVLLNTSSEFDDWMLVVNDTQKNDEGSYECFIPGEVNLPKLSHMVELNVNEDVRSVEFCSTYNVKCPKSKTCIDIMDFCDSNNNCGNDDQWDEMFCEDGYEARISKIFNCSHECKFLKEPGDHHKQFYNRQDYYYRYYPSCYCDTGYDLDRDEKTCLDIDECLIDNGGCSHICKNFPGSHTCSCFNEYQLSRDGKSCSSSYPDPDLYYSTASTLNNFQIHFERQFNFFKSNYYIVGLTFDHANNNITWIEKWLTSKQSAVKSMPITKLPIDDETDIAISTSTQCPEDVEMDRNTSMVYVADLCSSQIRRFSYQSSTISSQPSKFVEISAIENQFIKRPVALALDSNEGIMYWSDWGTDLGIQKSDISGTNAQVLVATDILKPKSLALDMLSSRLYWTDLWKKTIESIDTDGQNRMMVLSSEEYTPYALATFEDKVYFTNWKGKSVISCKKTRCLESIQTLFDDSEIITDLHIHHYSLNLI